MSLIIIMNCENKLFIKGKARYTFHKNNITLARKYSYKQSQKLLEIHTSIIFDVIPITRIKVIYV